MHLGPPLQRQAVVFDKFADETIARQSESIQSTVVNPPLDATASAPLANSATVFLNFGDNIPGSTIDDSGFLINFPLSLNPGGNFTGTLFSVALPPGVAPGSYTGFFEIFGGSNAEAGNPLATANFQINATPEPGTWVLLATGLCILAMGNFGRRYLPRASAT